MKKTVLITGASRGIGRATAILFAQHGFQVVINYQHSRQAAECLASALCSQGYSAVAYRAKNDPQRPHPIIVIFKDTS